MQIFDSQIAKKKYYIDKIFYSFESLINLGKAMKKIEKWNY